MDSDDLRQRRLQRLAMLEKSQSRSASSEGSNTPAEPRQEPANREEPPKEESKGPAAEPSKGVLKEPQSPAPVRKPVKPATVEPSASYVFGVPSAPEWTEIESDAHGFLWDELLNQEKPLSYLIGVWSRLDGLERTKAEFVEQMREAVTTLAFVSATAAEGEEVAGDLPATLLDASMRNQLPQQFVQRLFQFAASDAEAFPRMLESVLKLAYTLEFGDARTIAVFRVFEYVLAVPEAVEAVLQLPEAPTSAQNSKLYIARLGASFMGTIMGAGISAAGLKQIFAGNLLDTPLQEVVERAKQSEPVSSLLENAQFELVNKLVRQGEHSRRLVLQWFKAVLNVNHGQIATNRVPGQVSSLQLMLNCYKVLLRFAQPFVRLTPADLPKQLAKINRDYFAYASSYDISSDTKLLAAENAPFNSQSLTTPAVNFVTECFFLTAGYLEFGFHAAVQAMTGSLKQRFEHFDAQLISFDSDPNVQRLAPAVRDLTLKRFQDTVISLKCELAGVTALLHQPEFMGSTMRFAEFALSFAVYAAGDGKLEITAPYEKTPPVNFQSYPEFLLESTAISSSFVLRTSEYLHDPTLSGGQDHLLFDAAIFFMSSPAVVRNPYLRSKFVEVLFFGGVDVPLVNGSHIPGPLSTLFLSSDTCRTYLLRALMSVFIDIEHTGRNAQFYEKFTTRELVANVLKVIWRDPHYRTQLTSESQVNPEFFVKFVALLLNDATYLLDEALGKLHELNKLENGQVPGPAARQETAEPGDAAPSGEAEEGDDEDEDEESQDPVARLRSAERSAKNFLDLSKSTVTLLNTFTSTVPSIFATPEIIDRFAIMLNYNLAALVGPKCRELKVRNAAAVGFYPRQLLTDIIRVYLNLRLEPAFPKAVAKDERSYSDATMNKAKQILTKFNLLSPVDIEHFAELIGKTQEAWHEAQEEEEEFGDDVPDEFLDPLMFTLMENPVTLPTSKVSIDLSTIKTHLLSDPTDPFNRVPLKIEDVIPNEELKKQIDDFKRQKKEEHRRAKQDANAMITD